MLQSIRDRAQGIIVWTIVGLIIITFALFGLSSYLSGTAKAIVATVNGVEISETQLLREYQDTMQRLQQMLGENYRPELINENDMKERVLEGIIQRELINQELESNNFYVAPQQILASIENISAFQDATGKFSVDNYNRVLSLQGMDNIRFEMQMAHDIADEFLQVGLQQSAVVTDKQITQHQQLDGQQRQIGYFTLPLNAYLEKVSFTNEELQDYYDQNAARYSTPEQVSVDYVELNLKDMASRIEVTDEEARGYYEQNSENYISEPEQRKVRHILVRVDQDTDDAAARDKAEKLAIRINKGEDFNVIAKSESDDPGSASQGGDLGMIGLGMMDKAFEQAAFTLGKGKLSQPVRSRFGYHLILVDEIQLANIKPFSQAKDEIIKELQTQQAEQRFYEDVDKLNNLSYEIPDSLTPVAEELGLQVKQSPLFGRTGGAEIFSNPKITTVAFGDEVLVENRNSQLIEISDTHVMVLHMRDHKPASRRPLGEVKDEIIAALKQQKAEQLARTDAEQAISQLESGQSPESVATAFNQAWQDTGFVARKAGEGGEIDNRLRKTVFDMPRPEKGKPEFTSLAMPGGNVVVLALYDVKPGVADEKAETIQALQQQLGTVEGQAIYNAFVAYLKSTADITRNLKQTDQ